MVWILFYVVALICLYKLHTFEINNECKVRIFKINFTNLTNLTMMVYLPSKFSLDTE